jgi:hypothetical protein
MTTFDQKSIDLSFSARPCVFVRNRLYVLLSDLRPTLGMQWLPAADVTTAVPSGVVVRREGATMPVWYDGSGECYVRHNSAKPQRLPVVDLPLWIGIDNGGLEQRLSAA